MHEIINQDLISAAFDGYELLDSGQGGKLERIGGHLVQRPTPAAIWKPRLAPNEWEKASSICQRTRDGGGVWEHRRGDPGTLWATWSGPQAACRFQLGFTGFGHCGMFPEQAPVWAWLQNQVVALQAANGSPARIANLFAYTGCGSVAMAAAGAEVFHVDSAKGILQWTKDNIAANKNLSGSVRCLHEDARAFLRFSIKRGFKYHGLVMDPPAWGHGKAKETWVIENDLMDLLELSVACLEPGGFLHLSCHTPGIQEGALVACLSQVAPWQACQHGEFTLAHSAGDGARDQRVLPAGIYACATGYQPR